MKLTRRQFLTGAASAPLVPLAMSLPACAEAPPPSKPIPTRRPTRVADGLGLYRKRLLVLSTCLEASGSSLLRQSVELSALDPGPFQRERVNLTLLVGPALHVEVGDVVEMQMEWPLRRNGLVAGVEMKVALRHVSVGRHGYAGRVMEWCERGVEHVEIHRENEMRLWNGEPL